MNRIFTGAKKSWGSPKSSVSSQNGSPQSQGSYRSAGSSVRSSNYESCTSSPMKSAPGSKNDSPKDSPKLQISPVLNKVKQQVMITYDLCLLEMKLLKVKIVSVNWRYFCNVFEKFLLYQTSFEANYKVYFISLKKYITYGLISCDIYNI